jgi:tetratricopeptide (TPR) repeat protein
MGNRKFAVDFFNQAVASTKDATNPNRLTHAYQLFSSACLTDPLWGDAWYWNGNNNNDLNLYPAAIANWRQAINILEDKTLKAHAMNNLAWRLHTLGKAQEAYDWAMKALEIDDKLPAPWVNLSVIHTTMDQPTTALNCAIRGFDLSPDNAMHEFALAMAYMYDKQWAKGFKHYESRFAYRLRNYLQYPYPKWDGTPDKQVFLASDQGIGDTLAFSRFLPMACKRAQYVHASVQPGLFLLFQRAFFDIPNLNIIPHGNQFPPADVWTTFASLPATLSLTDEQVVNIPNIHVDEYDFTENWRIPDRKLHIGISWAGSPLNDIDKHRNIPVTQFFELYRVPGIQLYSLQKSEHNKEMYDAGGMALVWDLCPYIASIVDTMALLRKLDLVICNESALAHMCAMIGVECWVPYSYMGRSFYYGVDGKNVLWGPKTRTFRQGPDMSWEPVFAEIVEALRERVDAKRD